MSDTIDLTQQGKVKSATKYQDFGTAHAAREGGVLSSGDHTGILHQRGRSWALAYHSTQRLFDLQLDGYRDMLDQSPKFGPA